VTAYLDPVASLRTYKNALMKHTAHIAEIDKDLLKMRARSSKRDVMLKRVATSQKAIKNSVKALERRCATLEDAVSNITGILSSLQQDVTTLKRDRPTSHLPPPLPALTRPSKRRKRQTTSE